MPEPELDLLKAIIAHYAVGQITGYQHLKLGYVNTSYAITTLKNGVERKFLLRIYRRGIEEEEIVFEHSILRHLLAKGMRLTAAVVRAKNKRTYVTQVIDSDDHPGAGEPVFCALFTYLEGEDKYTWIRPLCTDGELVESAAVLARFHDAVCDLKPLGRRIEPKIINLLPLIETAIEARLHANRGTPVEACLVENKDLILGAIRRVRAEIEDDDFARTLHLVVHGDYHPGNLKFDGGKVVGLFDLDWSKIDARTFDVGLALTYFCASWDASHPADYFQLDKAAVFLAAYQQTLNIACTNPLDAIEVRFLPAMCAAGNIYVLEWALRDFYSKEVDSQEYLGYLQHHLHLMRWHEEASNRSKLEHMIARAVLPLGAIQSK